MVGKSNSRVPGACFDWGRPARVRRAMQYTQGHNVHDGYRIQFSEGVIQQEDTNIGLVSYLEDTQCPMFVSADVDVYARSVSYWRNMASWIAIYLVRMVVIGTFCDDLDEPLQSTFDADYWEVYDLQSGARIVNAPQYFRCDGLVTHEISEMDITVRNGNEFDETGGEFVPVDDWVTYSINSNKGLGEISIMPTAAIMAQYVNTKLRLDIIGKHKDGGAEKVDSFSFFVNDLVETECKRSYFNLDTVPETQLVRINAPEPVTFII